MSGQKPANPKASGATAQILAGVQKTETAMEQFKAELDAIKEMLADHSQILHSLDTRLDSARLSGSAKGGGRAKGSGGTNTKKENTPSAPPIHIWFINQWAEDEEDTVERYCDADNVEIIKKSVRANPTNKDKKDDVLKKAFARNYYTKHFSKRGADTYEEEGHNALKAAHSEFRKSLEKKSDSDGEDDE